jgi:hypothetical protein
MLRTMTAMSPKAITKRPIVPKPGNGLSATPWIAVIGSPALKVFDCRGVGAERHPAAADGGCPSVQRIVVRVAVSGAGSGSSPTP